MGNRRKKISKKKSLKAELKDLDGEFQYETGGSSLVDNDLSDTEGEDEDLRDTEVEDKDLFTADSETAKRIEESKLETIQTTFQKDEIEAKKKAEREARKKAILEKERQRQKAKSKRSKKRKKETKLQAQQNKEQKAANKLIKLKKEQQNKEQKAANKLTKPEQELYKRKAEDSWPRQNYITDVDNDMELPNKESEQEKQKAQMDSLSKGGISMAEVVRTLAAEGISDIKNIEGIDDKRTLRQRLVSSLKFNLNKYILRKTEGSLEKKLREKRTREHKYWGR